MSTGILLAEVKRRYRPGTMINILTITDRVDIEKHRDGSSKKAVDVVDLHTEVNRSSQMGFLRHSDSTMTICIWLPSRSPCQPSPP